MRKLDLAVFLLALPLASLPAPAQASLTIHSGKCEPITGLPFIADETIRTLQELANGVTLRHQLKARVVRSSQGVQRFESSEVTSDSAQPQSPTQVYVIDPVKHTVLSWHTSLKTATLTHLPANALATVNFLPQPRPAPGNPKIPLENVRTSDLGHQTLDKIDLVGTRLVTTIPVGKIGNEQPIEVTHEVWGSPELQLTFKESDQDPRAGNRTLEITHITREEPDASLFEVPAGYTVKERPAFGNLALANSLALAPDPFAQQIAEARNDPGPMLKNDVAYKLAMENTRLPDALSLALQAVEIGEQQTVNLAPKSLEAFSQMDTLSRYWNTLGWVYFRQGNLAPAETYTRAAWELSPQGYFGNHLGRIYEEQNRLQDAIAIYRRALSARESPKEADQLRSRLAGLGVANPEPLPAVAPIPLPTPSAAHPAAPREALFDLVLTHGNPPATVLLKGSPRLVKSALVALKDHPALTLPDSGPEKVLRRARVTCSRNRTSGCTLQLLTPQEAKVAVIPLAK